MSEEAKKLRVRGAALEVENRHLRARIAELEAENERLRKALGTGARPPGSVTRPMPRSTMKAMFAMLDREVARMDEELTTVGDVIHARLLKERRGYLSVAARQLEQAAFVFVPGYYLPFVKNCPEV